jgi:hypothetical protein
MTRLVVLHIFLFWRSSSRLARQINPDRVVVVALMLP